MSVVTATILSAGQEIPANYEILSIDISSEVNRIPRAQLVLIDGDSAKQRFQISNSNTFKPGTAIEIKLRYEGAPAQQRTLFAGLVVGQRVEASALGSLLTVELKDAALKLSIGRNSAVYHKQSDDQIIKQILTKNQLQVRSVPQTQPIHAELIQYYCSDWDFMLTRAEANGLVLSIDVGMFSFAKLATVGRPKHTFEYGISEIYDFEIEADASSQSPGVETIAWDARNQKLSAATRAKSQLNPPGNLDPRQVAQALGTETTVLRNNVILEPQELQTWADAALSRSRMGLVRGRIGVAGMGDINLLDVIEVAGVGARFNGRTLVTGIRHRVDQHGWRTDIQFGLRNERFAERPDIAELPAAGLVPAVSGLQIGIVDRFEEDPTNEYRVRVLLPSVDAQHGVIWARLATPDAGKNRGFFFRPEPGDEVVVGFFNDDPRQAVILGALYGSANAPHASVAQLAAENKHKAIVTKKGTIIGFVDDQKSAVYIETPAANKLILDDNDQVIRLSDQHGNSITLGKEGVVIKSAKDLILEASGKVEIRGEQVDIK